MEKEEHALLLLNTYLEDAGLDRSELSLFEINTLEKLSTIATDMISKQQKAYETIRKNKISISNLCGVAGVNRSSVYKNKTVYGFLSYATTKNLKASDIESEDKIKELQAKIKTFYKLDNAVCRTECENKKLHEENNRLRDLVAKQNTLLHQNGIPRPLEFTKERKEFSIEDFKKKK